MDELKRLFNFMSFRTSELFDKPEQGSELSYRLVDEIVDSVRKVDAEKERLTTLLNDKGGEMGDVQRVLVEAEISTLSSRRDILMCRFKDLGGNVHRIIGIG